VKIFILKIDASFINVLDGVKNCGLLLMQHEFMINLYIFSAYDLCVSHFSLVFKFQ